MNAEELTKQYESDKFEFQSEYETTKIDFEHNLSPQFETKEQWVENRDEVGQHIDILFWKAQNYNGWDFKDLLKQWLVDDFGTENMSLYFDIEEEK